MGKVKWSMYAENLINLEDSDSKEYKVEIINEESRKIINESAIYWVCLKETTVPRIAGEDYDGTLVIGKTKNLEYRFKQFISGLEMARGHSEANLLHYLFWKSSSFKNRYIKNRIAFYYLLTPIKDLEEKERNNIIWYIKKYGEPPVLNRSIPKRYGEW